MIEPRIVTYPFGDKNYTSALFYGADVRKSLRGFKEGSVQCVVTSPPYWGLRDYGTGSWEGGDPACAHSVGGQVQDTKYTGAITTGQRPGVDASHCRLCGATRVDDQIGLERSPEDYVTAMVEVFREVRRVLRDDGVLWLNLGDSYTSGGRDSRAPDSKDSKGGRENDSRPPTPSGLKPKDLVGIPWMVAFALRADGWYLRSDVIWSKGNPFPESVTDRPTRSHEYIFLLTKNPHYFYDQIAVKEPISEATKVDPRIGTTRDRDYTNAGKSFGVGTSASRRMATNCVGGGGGLRNQRSVWTINPKPYKGAHFATMPTALAELCIKAGSSEKGCCPTCGVPWARVLETVQGAPGTRYRSMQPYDTSENYGTGGGNSGLGEFAKKVREGTHHKITAGWAPTCNCPAHEPVPCVVLDPFSGSGTTGYVANRLGRNYVGTDLNTDYLPLAEARLMGMDPPEDEELTEDTGDTASIMDMFGGG